MIQAEGIDPASAVDNFNKSHPAQIVSKVGSKTVMACCANKY